MDKILDFLKPFTDFIGQHFEKILVAIACIITLYLGYLATSYSLKKLKPSVFSYYPFDKFFPKSGSWSVGYFLITIIFLGILVYFFAKGGFYLAPA